MSKLDNSVAAYKKVCKVLEVKPVAIGNIPSVSGTIAVIVPDQVFSWAKLKKLAMKFGQNQRYRTYIYEDLYKQYSAEELSGKPTGKEYRVIYIPKEYNVEPDTVAKQWQEHANDYVPSVLEAIVYWFTLRESGEELTFDKTYIRHFDLPEKRVVDWSYVPLSYVYLDGGPYLDRSIAEYASYGRVAVRSKLESSPSVPLSLEIDLPKTITVNGVEYVQK